MKLFILLLKQIHTTLAAYTKIKPNKSNPHYTQCELIARPELITYDLIEAADVDNLIRQNQANKQSIDMFFFILLLLLSFFYTTYLIQSRKKNNNKKNCLIQDCVYFL